MNVPISGPSGLAITKPGVYPMLININGIPDYGRQARLATDAVLLPVRSVPGSTAPRTRVARAADRAVAAGRHRADHVLRDHQRPARPHRRPPGRPPWPAAAGCSTCSTRPGTHPPRRAPALCYAIDPDLLDTVVAMSHGYLVHTSGGGTAHRRGHRRGRPSGWARCAASSAGTACCRCPSRTRTSPRCPARGALDLERLAISQEANLAADLKPASIQQLSNVLWPLGNAIDQHTMTDLAGLGPSLNQTTVLVEPDALTPPSGYGTVPLTGVSTVTPTRAVVVDQLISGALDGSADRSTVAGAPSQPSSQSVLNTENGIGALLYQSVFGNSRNQPMLIAPPRRWSASLP